MKKNIQEEIERIKLLSNYDNTKTLNENVQGFSVISEQGLYGSLLKRLGLAGKEGKTLATKTMEKELESIFKTNPSLLKNFGVDAKEVISNLKKGLIKGDDLGILRKEIFKRTQNQGLKTKIADEMISQPSIRKELSNIKNEQKALDFLRKKGYAVEDASLLIKRYIANEGKFADDISRELGKQAKRKYQEQLTKQRMWEAKRYTSQEARQGLSLIKGTKGVFTLKTVWTLIKIAATIGVAYAIWSWMTKNDKTGYPKCLSDGIPSEDFEKMVKEGREYILNTDLGIDDIDSKGGGRFYQNGKFETEDTSISGNWKEVPGEGIVITTSDGNEFVLPCEDIEGDPNRIEDVIPTIEYKETSDFPMGVGAINMEVIGLVQNCLGLPVTGKFDPTLEAKLIELGYGSTLDRTTLSIIKRKCGITSQEFGFASKFTK